MYELAVRLRFQIARDALRYTAERGREGVGKHALAIPSNMCRSIVLSIEPAIGKSVGGVEES